MKTLKSIDQEIEKVRQKLKKITNSRKSFIISQKIKRLKNAKTKAKFKVGDIITYCEYKPAILVTSIECYDYDYEFDVAEPVYKGFQIINGRLTRNFRSSAGHGTQDPYIGGDGNRYPKQDWKKISDCTNLKFNPENK